MLFSWVPHALFLPRLASGKALERKKLAMIDKSQPSFEFDYSDASASASEEPSK
jgi:hypothetical protein